MPKKYFIKSFLVSIVGCFLICCSNSNRIIKTKSYNNYDEALSDVLKYASSSNIMTILPCSNDKQHQIEYSSNLINYSKKADYYDVATTDSIVFKCRIINYYENNSKKYDIVFSFCWINYDATINSLGMSLDNDTSLSLSWITIKTEKGTKISSAKIEKDDLKNFTIAEANTILEYFNIGLQNLNTQKHNHPYEK